MITKPLTLEGFEKLLKDWCWTSNDSVYLKILPDVLKSDIGGVLDHALPTKQDICYGIMEINFAFSRLRKMAAYLQCREIIAVKAYKHLLNDVKELLFESGIEDSIWDSIAFWIDETLNQEKIDREYAQRKSDCFNELISVLEECFKISRELHDKEREANNAIVNDFDTLDRETLESSKGGASC